MTLSNYITMFSKFILENVDKMLLGAMIVSLLILAVFIRVNIKLSKVIKSYNNLMEGVDGKNLEDILLYHAEELKNMRYEQEALGHKVDYLEEENLHMIKKVYSKRYDAFSGMGGGLSFSVALLNQKNTGVIITSIYGRDENRVYLKPIIEGKSEYNLAPEEQEIVSKAILG